MEICWNDKKLRYWLVFGLRDFDGGGVYERDRILKNPFLQSHRKESKKLKKL